MRPVLLLALCCLLFRGADGQPGFDLPGANDHIFPPAARAKPFIDFDARGFLVGGKRVFLVSAGMEYWRVPRGFWQDLVLPPQGGGVFFLLNLFFFAFFVIRGKRRWCLAKAMTE